MINRRLVPSLFVCAALASGCGSAPSASEPGSSEPAVSASGAPSLTPSDTITTLGPEELALDAGTYRFDLNEVAVGGAEFPPVLITVPEGWSYAGWRLYRPATGDEELTAVVESIIFEQ